MVYAAAGWQAGNIYSGRAGVVCFLLLFLTLLAQTSRCWLAGNFFLDSLARWQGKTGIFFPETLNINQD